MVNIYIILWHDSQDLQEDTKMYEIKFIDWEIPGFCSNTRTE